MKIISILLSTLILMASGVNSQNITVNPGNGSYPTLFAACTAINNGLHTGNVVVTIAANTTETQSCVLQQKPLVLSLQIRPSGNRSITGLIDGAPLLDISGADNVTIDGLGNGGNNLTIQNNSTSTVANTSTMMIRNDAVGITINNCTLLGSSLVSGSGFGGTLVIGNTFQSQTATGNDNITISGNKIGPAGSNIPSKAVLIRGSISSATNYNENILFANNNVYDFFQDNNSSYGLLAVAGVSQTRIKGNRFYQTATRAHNAQSVVHTAIEVDGGTLSTGIVIEENIIGFENANETGLYRIISPGFTPRFYGINANDPGNIVRKNKIAGIYLESSTSGTGFTNPFAGIRAADGAVIVGNIIGDTLTTSSITYLTDANGSSEIYGIYANGTTNNMQADSNIIAGIRMNTTGLGAIIFNGIYVRTAVTSTNSIKENKLGTAVAPIDNQAASLSSRIIGIRSENAKTDIQKNIISYLQTATANIGSTTGNPVTGIDISNSNNANTINNVTGNTIHHLSNLHPTSSGWVKGIDFRGPSDGTHNLSENFIHNLYIPNSSSTTGTIVGINMNSSSNPSIKGVGTYANNMIALNTATNTNSVRIYGFYETTSGNLNRFYHNSIYLGASASSGSETLLTGIRGYNTDRTYLNNIIVVDYKNVAGSENHYALMLFGAGNVPNPPGLVSNRNVLLATGHNAAIGLFGNVNCVTLANWQTSSGQDANSVAADPLFAAPLAANPDLHLQPDNTSPAENIGTPVPGITTDIDGDTRSATPDAGADEKNNPLPVTWSPLKVTEKGNLHELSWVTYTETDNLGFEIESATNGIDFTRIGKLASLAPDGNSSLPLHYRFTHTPQNNGTQWYRIKQVDKNGKYAYSNIVVVLKQNINPVTLQLWPNPVRNNLNIALKGQIGNGMELKLVNMSGQTLWIRKVDNSNTAMDMYQLPAGVYTIIATQKGVIIHQQRFLKN